MLTIQRAMKQLRTLFLSILITIFAVGSEAFASVDLLNVRHWTAPSHTRVVLDLTGEASVKILQEGRTVYVDLEDTILSEEILLAYEINKPAVEKVLLGSLPGGGIRVELRITDNVKTNVFKLGAILDKPHRIVIDLLLPDIEKQESEEREKVKVLKKKVVVIDPGHGGEDPGAIGRRGTREKTVVFGIAEKLQKILKARGYEAFLTRTGDYFISLKNRGTIAREYGADIFVSIHADACRSRSARGSSVYCLSTGGASSEAAKLLAQSENLSDIIGGSENENGNGDSGPIALDMLQTETLNRSRTLGTVALEKMKDVNRLKSSQVQEAPFRVLKLPDVTSLLIETAYISNAEEEGMLRSASGQTDMAWAIAYAIDEFLPLPEPADEKWSKEFITPVTPTGLYLVQRGDSLEGIARKHGTTLNALMEANKIQSKDRIYVGQKLKLHPGHEDAEKPSVYVVKRGDILGTIAREYGTTTQALMEANGIRARDRIYIGRKLKIPSGAPVQAPAKPSVHVVQRGDNLESIARESGTTIAALMRANKIRSRDRIYIGQKLKIPSGTTVDAPSKPTVYVVQRGDSLGSIAVRHGTTIKTLMEVNRIKAMNRIYVGQKLKIPYV